MQGEEKRYACLSFLICLSVEFTIRPLSVSAEGGWLSYAKQIFKIHIFSSFFFFLPPFCLFNWLRYYNRLKLVQPHMHKRLE